MRIRAAVLALIVSIPLTSGCEVESTEGTEEAVVESSERGPGYVTREDFGDDWPLTVDSAEVRCEEGRFVVLEAEGETYGLTGAAQTHLDLAPPDPIWRNAPDVPEGMEPWKVSLRPLTERGLELCEG